MTPEAFLKQKREIEKLGREEQREQGRLEECLKRVKKIAGTDDLKKARKVLSSMSKELEQEQSKIDRMWREWESKWKDKLGNA